MEYNILLKKAQEASQNAYAPYSDFQVGACVLAKSGKTYSGCNMENASYGLTVCAERNALANAIVNGEREIVAIAIWATKMDNCLPCGACRQVIFEFQKENGLDVITQDKNDDNGYVLHKIDGLLPEGFKL
jgi:cytidine deaminase